MSMDHLTIISDGEEIGHVWVEGHEVKADTPQASHFVHHVVEHPRYRTLHGPDLLNAIEHRLDKDSRVGTRRSTPQKEKS